MSCTDRSLVFNREWPLKKKKKKRKRDDNDDDDDDHFNSNNAELNNDRQITLNSFLTKFERSTMIVTQ